MKNWIKKNKADLILYGMFIGVLVILIILAVLPQIGKIGTNEPYNPQAITFGNSFGIQWYALFIVSGLVMAAYFAMVEFKRLGWKTDDLLDGLLIIAPLSILGARAYYLIFSANTTYTFVTFFQNFFKFRQGGLAIHGAIIVAVIGVVIFSRYKKLNVFILADVLAIGLLIGQISGRWGNFMNAEAHGDVVNSSFISGIIPGFIRHQMQFSGSSMLPSGFHHPTFLYESLWNFIALTFLLVARRKRWFRAGDMIGFYLIWYGLGRSFLEAFYRTDQLRVIFNFLPVNVLLSIVLLAGGGALYLILKRVFIKDQLYYVDENKFELDTPWEKVENVV